MRVRLPRRLGRSAMDWKGRPSGVVFDSVVLFALSEGCAFWTGDLRLCRAPSGSSSANKSGASQLPPDKTAFDMTLAVVRPVEHAHHLVAGDLAEAEGRAEAPGRRAREGCRAVPSREAGVMIAARASLSWRRFLRSKMRERASLRTSQGMVAT